MMIRSVTYVKGAAEYGQCIVSDLRQIAVVGKSNVGKSSFINMLSGDSKLARTSKNPGRTRLINYFLVNEKNSPFFLTDLPGYGFAKVSDAEKEKWASVIDSYLAKEQMLCHVFFLVDIRHKPTADDFTMYNYLFKNNVSYTVVATKSDKVSKSQVANRKRSIASYLKIGEANIIAVSSQTLFGKEAIISRMEQALAADYTVGEEED